MQTGTKVNRLSTISTTALAALVAVAIALVASLGIATASPQVAYAKSTVTFKVTGYVDYGESYAFLAKLNKLRASKGLSKLTMDKQLMKAAEQRAAELSVIFSHTRPNGKRCFTASKYLAGENIQYSFADADIAYTDWKNSPPHYKNMITASYRTAGVCCYERDGTTYWVNLFGTKSTGKVKKSGEKKITRKVTLAKKYLKKSNLDLAPYVMETEDSQKAIVYFFPKVSERTGTLPASLFTFKSSKPSVISVSKNGTLTSNAEGTASITIKAKCKKSCKYTQKIQVDDSYGFYDIAEPDD